ncbi:glycosyltransferase [Halotalea alkalilenta]|uniref:glycosyltransferase n=1 Tax=Halotalea alkalilenta TaxID=376489 RepID=UPI000ABBFDA1|nr:glycosyltransferase [Halotalea alkalilenta]
MKICFFIGAMSRGGAERQLVYVASGLVNKGHDVILLTLKSGNEYLDLLDSRVDVYCLEVKNFFDAVKKTNTFFKKNNPDVVINFLYHASIIGRLLGKYNKIKTITSHRNSSLGSYSRNFIFRHTAYLDNKTLTNVKASEKKMHPAWGAPKLIYIPNMYIRNIDKSNEQIILDNDTKTFNWCFIGRLEKQKNLPNLIRALKMVNEKSGKKNRLFILGEGSDKAELDSLVSQLNLEKSVFFEGFTRDTLKYLKISNAFILPSLWEGMPNALIEAMDAAIPVIATPVGVNSEIIQDGLNGFLTDNTSANAIAEKMYHVINLPEDKLIEVGVEARKSVEQKFSPDIILSQWEKVLIEN